MHCKNNKVDTKRKKKRKQRDKAEKERRVIRQNHVIEKKKGEAISAWNDQHL